MQRPFWNQPRLRRALVNAAIVAVSSVAATACSDSSTEPGGDIVKLVIVQTPISQPHTNMLRGITLQLIAVPINADSNFVNTPVTWSTSDATKATVDQTGKVTTVAGGNVTISAAAGGQTGTYDLNIQFPVASVVVTPTGQTIRQEGTLTMAAALTGTDGQPAVGRTIVWSSSNTAIATVNASTGVVSGVANGTANIIATSEGVSGQTAVTVNGVALVNSVTVAGAGSSTFKGIGETLQLTQTSKSQAGNTIAGTTATWSTGSAAIATITPTGLVTCVSAGTTTMTATVDNGIGTNVTGTLAITCATIATTGATALPAIASGTQQTYAFVVPAGTTSLTIALSGGTGDPDLYVWTPSQTAGAFTANGGFANGAVSGNNGPSESLTFTPTGSATTLAAGTWRISIHAFPSVNNSGTTMTITKTP